MSFNKGNEEGIFISSSACINFILGQYPSGQVRPQISPWAHHAAGGNELSFPTLAQDHVKCVLGALEADVKASSSKTVNWMYGKNPILLLEEGPNMKITWDWGRMCWGISHSTCILVPVLCAGIHHWALRLYARHKELQSSPVWPSMGSPPCVTVFIQREMHEMPQPGIAGKEIQSKESVSGAVLFQRCVSLLSCDYEVCSESTPD